MMSYLKIFTTKFFHLLSGHQYPDNFPATEIEECCPKDTPADQQQVRRRAVDSQRPSGESGVFQEQEHNSSSTGPERLGENILVGTVKLIPQYHWNTITQMW